ncbi:hypothetical protein H9L12_12150 [Sphingomonas rhizophila]|uniref:DUF4175 domain-containing protein n=1 Tax=Sphingomonas rhizophila TaxID=2071607 RepID=A0A7G9SAS0_9SPHN|nr:hypothetical protein [Sphingomonas rhizophila]QNN64945.1 hypothetical protein H9L12_12150 [Sphingomonas rhizophila]
MSDRPEWFAPKRYGLGAGWPIAWQGWAVLAAFMLLVGIALLIFGPDDPAALAIVIPAVIGLAIVTALTTRGGWRWRWGNED